jgi:uncharacterized membrane protein
MGLSPEERRKIYEEEKARIEAREQLEREKKYSSPDTSTGLMPNVASMLCYLGAWITGIIFLVLEQNNARVRFHAAQSIVTFGALSIVGSLLGLIPVVGHAFSAIIGIVSVILWVVLMVKAYNGEMYRLPVAADIADKLSGTQIFTGEPAKSPAPAGPESPPAETPQPETSQPVHPVQHANLDKEIGRKIEEYFARKRGGRIVSSAFTIAFSIAALIFFNYFNEYVAYYSSERIGDVVIWTRTPFFTDDIRFWLPILTTALVVSIVGHFILIVFDRYVLRELTLIIIDVFALASVVTLVTVFPFNFFVIPSTSIAEGVELGVTVVLIVTSVAIGIGIVVRGIKLLFNLIRGTAGYEHGA